MKAVFIEEHGDIDKLIVGERPDPRPGPRRGGDSRSGQRASTTLTSACVPAAGAAPGSLPRILGCDMAGEVAELGEGVTGLSLSDKVLVDNRVKCVDCTPCLQGQDQYCERQLRIGVDLDGGHAELCSVPAVNVHRFADSMTFEEAAAVPLAFHTAWHCLMVRAELQPWETILVQAGGSGVGSAAIQIAKRIGARVITTTAGSDEKLAVARNQGADDGINYRATSEFSRAVLELTGGVGVDVVLDVVGAAVWRENLLSLRPGGRLVITGVTSGSQTDMDLALLQGAAAHAHGQRRALAPLVRGDDERDQPRRAARRGWPRVRAAGRGGSAPRDGEPGLLRQAGRAQPRLISGGSTRFARKLPSPHFSVNVVIRQPPVLCWRYVAGALPERTIYGGITMISASLQDALNEQIANELSAGYLYLSHVGILRVAEPAGLRQVDANPAPGGDRARHEDIRLCGGPGAARVILRAIDAPPSEFGSVESAIDPGVAARAPRHRPTSTRCTRRRSGSATTPPTCCWSGSQTSRWRRRRPWRSCSTTCAWWARTARGLLILDERLGNRTAAP